MECMMTNGSIFSISVEFSTTAPIEQMSVKGVNAAMGEMKLCVERGAQLLDAMYPGWYKIVNTSTLDIGAYNYCVLGQVFGSYGEGLDVLFSKNTTFSIPFLSIKHGFSIPSGKSGTIWDILASLWKKTIEARRLKDIQDIVDSQTFTREAAVEVLPVFIEREENVPVCDAFSQTENTRELVSV